MKMEGDSAGYILVRLVYEFVSACLAVQYIERVY
jgi:hypothetical protein